MGHRQERKRKSDVAVVYAAIRKDLPVLVQRREFYLK